MDNYLRNLILLIVLVTKYNLIIVLLLSKGIFAGNIYRTGRSGVARGGPMHISGEDNL